ncbi:ribonuclease domain-containing protein [Saccharopolyspora halophila]|uniref:Ribonuclease domain-containing protein n=1 Tax=Saccharopolyspora halophila TaxID=405551 RepID=A0ABN3GF52_9PSEU
MSSRKRISSALIGLVALVVLGWFGQDIFADSQGSGGSVPGASESGLPVEELSSLPPEADKTWGLIEQGGPFPYPGKDGSVFGNYEGELPDEKRGYYHEYTVPTPGEPDRGARRLVTGGQDEVYYTNDHYESFVVVDTDG